MIITSIQNQKKNINRKSIFIDEQYAFGIDDEDFYRLGLCVGKELTCDEIERINRTCNFSKARKAAVKYIMYKRRTEFEVKTKLEQVGFDENIIESVICKMRDLKYVDDSDYAERYIKDALNLKKLGKNRIKFELQRKGIPRHIIHNKIDDLVTDEIQMLRALIERRIEKIDVLDRRSLNKIRNRFIRRGYRFDNINTIIKEVTYDREIIDDFEKRDNFEL